MLRVTWLYAALVVVSIGALVSCSSGGSDPTAPAPAVVHVAGYYSGGTYDIATYWLDDATGAQDLNAGTASRGLGVFVYGSDVYVAGYYKNADTLDAAGYWKNGSLTTLDSDEDLTLPDNTARATAVHVDATGVYVAGYTVQSGVKRACYWKDGARTDLGTAPSEALGITASGGNVYVAGFHRPGAVDVACYWVNDDLGLEELYTAASSKANAIAFDGTHVYAAGRYLVSTTSYACYWTDNAASRTELNGEQATSIVVSGGIVYSAGVFSNGTNNAACTWKGGTRTTLFSDTTTPGQAAFAYSLFVHGGDVYVAGYSPDGGYNAACYWKNGVRTVLHSTSSSSALGIFVTD